MGNDTIAPKLNNKLRTSEREKWNITVWGVGGNPLLPACQIPCLCDKAKCSCGFHSTARPETCCMLKDLVLHLGMQSAHVNKLVQKVTQFSCPKRGAKNYFVNSPWVETCCMLKNLILPCCVAWCWKACKKCWCATHSEQLVGDCKILLVWKLKDCLSFLCFLVLNNEQIRCPGNTIQDLTKHNAIATYLNGKHVEVGNEKWKCSHHLSKKGLVGINNSCDNLQGNAHIF